MIIANNLASAFTSNINTSDRPEKDKNMCQSTCQYKRSTSPRDKADPEASGNLMPAADVVGMPPQQRREWTLDTDPRTWPTFSRVSLRDGVLTPDKLIARGKRRSGKSLRPPSEYLGKIPSEKYEVEAGRYHIFVSGICPWASSVATARHLLGLEDVISMDIADGQSGAGWTYLGGASVAPWKDRPGPFWLHEAYQLDNSHVTTRITVPVLWDKKTNSIVSNDSWTIVKMLSTAFAGMGKPLPESLARMATDFNGNPTLTPKELEFPMEKCHEEIYDALLNGVYKAGLGLFINGNEENDVVRSSRESVYSKLSELNRLLSTQRFLLGDKLTAPDLRLAMTLFRWDCYYRNAFCLQGGRGGILLGDGYLHLKAYLRDLFVVMQPVIDFVAIRQYYRIPQAVDKAAGDGIDNSQEEKKEEELPQIPDLRPIIASAKESAGPRPSSPTSRGFVKVCS